MPFSTGREKEATSNPNETMSVKQRESDFKASHVFLIAFFTLVISLHVIGTYLFTSGFLLTRLVLDHKSDCALPPATLHSSWQPGSSDVGCWHPKTFNKVVIILIDALRYDFTIPFSETPTNDPNPHHYHDAVPMLYETAVSQPNNAILLPFIADPPTTTLQRLKGLTTGTLPTFIDAGSNFAGTAIDEDNLIGQFLTAGKTIAHLGDDTWHALFPGSFDANLTKPYDSFNVWDLHTVDNGVSEHLLPLLQPANVAKWDVLIGHYLGVDHAGHRYGPDHPAMASKLNQMNVVLGQVKDLIEDDTLLVVMGDHGMDAKGDHGGESDDEVEAALWMYSKKPIFGTHSQNTPKKPSATAKINPVNQIDLVPTLALLLGLPVPFNNLGSPIAEAFVGTSGNNLENLATVNRLTAAQVHRYQQEYAVIRKPDPLALARPTQAWKVGVEKWSNLATGQHSLSKDDWLLLADAFALYSKVNLSACKDMWARFDMIRISQGVAVLSMSLAILSTYARGLPHDTTAVNGALILRAILGMAIGAGVGSAIGLAFPIVGLFPTSLFFAATVCCVVLAAKLWSSRLVSIIPSSLWSWSCILSVLLISTGFAANSFTIWEDEILLFFLAMFGSLLFVASLRLKNNRDRLYGCCHAAIFTVLLRLASLSRLCRDEQMPYCRQTFYASAASSTSAPWQLAIPYIIALVLPSAIKGYYTRTQSWHGSAPFWIGIAFRTSLLIIAVFWTLDAADNGEWFRVREGLLKTIRMYLAQLVLAIATGAGTATFALQAPYMSIQTIELPSESSLDPIQDPRSRILAKSNGAMELKPLVAMKPKLIVEGTSNLYGSHFAMLPTTVLLLPLLLLQKPMGQATLALTTLAIFSLLELLPLLHRLPRVGSDGNSCLPKYTTDTTTTVVGPTILALLGHFAFFKTGHQAALASIQWDTAFIPLRTIRYPWSPLFMILNTFAGQMLCAAAVPACVLWRRSYEFAPSIVSIHGQDGADEESVGKVEATTLTAFSESSNAQASSRNASSNNGAHTDHRAISRTSLLSSLSRAMATHFLVYAVINLATTVFAAHLRRHLMLYRVFMPRWMLGVAGLVIAEVVGVFVAILSVRWSVSSVGKVFGW